MKKIISLFVTAVLLFTFTLPSLGDDALMNDALKVLDKGIKYFHSISINGGYVYTYTLDLKGRWGEGLMGRGKDGQASPTQIWIQPPGTPTVGEAFLRAYKLTGEKEHLFAAVFIA